MHKTLIRPLLILFSIFCSLHSIAQVTGKVITENKQPMPYCQVVLTKSTDTNSIVATATTDIDGKFEIKGSYTGSFILIASSLSYEKYFSPVFTLTDESSKYDAGTITLKTNAQFLKRVDVVAQKPFVEYKADRTVYNIENSIISAGDNMFDVLKKLPGVSINNSDNLSVNGQQGVLILIDGRPLYLSAADAANYLKSLNASQVEKVEVIKSPSAKYDAAGSSVINIVMKRNKDAGLNGEINSAYTQGIYGRGSDGLNLGYRLNKWDFFANYGFYFVNRSVNERYTTQYIQNGIPQGKYVDSLQKKLEDIGHNTMFMVNFIPDKNQEIGFVCQGMYDKTTLNKNYMNRVYDQNSVLDSNLGLLGHRTAIVTDITLGLNYSLKLDTLGKELTADIDYSTHNVSFNEQDINSFYDPFGEQMRPADTLDFSLPIKINIWAAKADYTQPLGKQGKLEAGLKVSYVSTTNNAQYWNVVNGVNIVDTSFTNNFDYIEYIYAGYINYNGKMGHKLDYRLGLRGEETEDKGVQLVNDTTFSHNYFNLFPNALITYKLDSLNSLQLYYRRRIWRPDYQDLNPFTYVLGQYFYNRGNPALQPQISNAIMLSEIYKQVLNIGFGDEYWTSVISQVATENAVTHTVYNTTVNVNTFNNLFAKVDLTLPIAKWFTTMNSLLFMQRQYQGQIDGVNLTRAQFTWTLSTVNNVILGKNWSVEADFNYSSQSIDAVMLTQPVYVLNAGIKKTFAKNKGTASLSFQDILWSDRYTTTELFMNTNYTDSQYSDSRIAILSLSWRFGKSQQERQEKEKAAEEEMNRVR